MMRPTLLSASALVVAVLAVAVAGCAARGEMKVTTTWQDEDSRDRPLGGTIVLGIVDDADLQRYFETRLTQALSERGVRAASAVDVLPPVDRGAKTKVDRDALESAVRSSGYDSILITLPVSEHTDTDYVPGMWTGSGGGGYYGYYSWGWGAVYHPGYYVDSTLLTIETHLYDTRTAKLVWMAVSEVSEPDGIDDAFTLFATMMAERLTGEVTN